MRAQPPLRLHNYSEARQSACTVTGRGLVGRGAIALGAKLLGMQNFVPLRIHFMPGRDTQKLAEMDNFINTEDCIRSL